MLSVQNISKLLGKKELFCNVSFHVRPGDRIGLIGPNGAGKTTLFHILMGEIEPDTGHVSANRNTTMGYLPQEVIPAEGRTVLAHDTSRQFGATRNRHREATGQTTLAAGR